MTPGDEAAWQDLVEKTDRSSPPEYPDHALITRDELLDYLRAARASERERCAVMIERELAPPVPHDAKCSNCNGKGSYLGQDGRTVYPCWCRWKEPCA